MRSRRRNVKHQTQYTSTKMALNICEHQQSSHEYSEQVDFQHLSHYRTLRFVRLSFLSLYFLINLCKFQRIKIFELLFKKITGWQNGQNGTDKKLNRKKLLNFCSSFFPLAHVTMALPFFCFWFHIKFMDTLTFIAMQNNKNNFQIVQADTIEYRLWSSFQFHLPFSIYTLYNTNIRVL